MRKSDLGLTLLALMAKGHSVTTVTQNVNSICSFCQKLEYLHVVNHSAIG